MEVRETSNGERKMTYSKERVVELGSVAEREYQTVYVLDGITYLPHYTDEGCFVGPGFGRENHNVHTAQGLLRKGAKEETAYLLERFDGRLIKFEQDAQIAVEAGR